MLAVCSPVTLARICVASIRYWYPEVPICLLRDHGRGAVDTRELETAWQAEAMDSDPRYSGWGTTKLSLLFRPNTVVIDIPYHTEDPGHGVTPREPEDSSR